MSRMTEVTLRRNALQASHTEISSVRSRSGLMFSSPIFCAFSASSRNASAIELRASPPPADSAVSVFQSTARIGVSIASIA